MNKATYDEVSTSLDLYWCLNDSDGLDLFTTRDRDFSEWVERFYAALERESWRGDFSILTDRVRRFEDYVQVFLQRPAQDNKTVTLKVDIVNDVAPHYGDIASP